MYLSGVDYFWIIVMVLSAVWTLILTAPIHCRGPIMSKWCNATLLQICSDEETNSSTSWMAWVSKHFWLIKIVQTIPLTHLHS